jgi:predicted GIY-YIG superfamily endonuclease
MPKTVSDYSKNVIYKIQHNDDDSLLYVGHTTNFIKRKHHHKKNSIEKTTPVYKMMRENGGWNCFTMIVIKEFPCASKTEACIEEDKIMREMKASMNTLRAYSTPEEKKKQQKEYMKENREPIREYKKAYQQANKESLCEYKKEYYQENKELLSEKAKEPIECECGCIIRKSDLAKHKKTKKHLNNLK